MTGDNQVLTVEHVSSKKSGAVKIHCRLADKLERAGNVLDKLVE